MGRVTFRALSAVLATSRLALPRAGGAILKDRQGAPDAR